MPTAILLVILGLCVLASGFFSGSETALVAIPRERVHQLEDRDSRGRRLAELVGDMERTLGALLVANNFVNILGASVATVLAIQLISNSSGADAGSAWGPWLSTAAFTAVILVVGEITPKTLAARHPDQFALAVAPTIWFLAKWIWPVTALFVGIGRMILRLFGVGEVRMSPITEEDIKAMAKLGEAAGQIDSAEREIIDSVFTMADRPVREAMTPRVDVEVLEAPLTEAKIQQAVAATGHSRYPVIDADGNLDDIRGILYVKDLLRVGDGLESVSKLLRVPHYVPESTSVLGVFQQMRLRKLGFAVVLDEHGGVDGIVTIKDLMAELVGELQDEYDPGIPAAVAMADEVWIVDGRMTVEDVSDVIGVELPDGEYTTLGGLVLWLAGDIPDEGATLELDRAVFTVERMERLRVDRVRVERLPEVRPPDSDQ